ncbi:MAG: hypothetical protein ACRDNC_07615, partial [Gaiellaceae bacterium]
RYLVQRGDATIASAEIHTDATGIASGGLEVNEGPFVRATEAAVRKAETLPQLDRATYELRLVRIPAVYVIALWLKAEGNGEDVLIPIGETPPEVEPDRPYRPDELLGVLVEPARRQLEFDSSPGTRKQSR